QLLGKAAEESEGDEGQAKDDERRQEAAEQLAAGAGIFERIAADADAAPEVAPDAGAPPEAIEAERADRQQQIAHKQHVELAEASLDREAMRGRCGESRRDRGGGARRRVGVRIAQ